MFNSSKIECDIEYKPSHWFTVWLPKCRCEGVMSKINFFISLDNSLELTSAYMCLPACNIRAGNKSLSDWGIISSHHQPSVSLCPPLPSSPLLSMPQLKLLHSSQSSFQDNKFDARRSSLCAGVFTQISRYQGSCRMGDSVDEYQDQSYEYQQTGTGF